MGDNLARPRSISPSSIRALLDKGKPESEAETREVGSRELEGPAVERTDPLPRPGEPYRMHARHGNKPELTLHFVLKDFAYEGFSYADCERVRLVPGDKPGSGPVLLLRFNGSVVTDVRIEGRHLHSLYHWIGLHQVAWVWEYPGKAEFADEAEPIIRKITIEEPER